MPTNPEFNNSDEKRETDIGTEGNTRLRELEEKTDKIFGLRSDILSIYKKISDHLPRDNNRKKLYFPEILERVDQGENLDDLIFPKNNSNKSAEEEMPPTPSSQSQGTSEETKPVTTDHEQAFAHEKKPTLEEEVQREIVRNTFEMGIILQRELNLLEGEFRGGSNNLTVERFYRYRLGEFSRRLDKISAGETELGIIEGKIRLIRQKGVSGDIKQDVLAKMVRNYREQMVQIKAQIKQETEKSPEAYLYAYGNRLREIKNSIDSRGRIIVTPYVESRIDIIEEGLDNNRPIFIHGELGSGKTELAKYVARKRLQREWEEKNPEPLDKNSEEHGIWLRERDNPENFEPFIINGHRGLDPDVFTAARTIRKADTPSPEEQTTIITTELENYRREGSLHNDILKEAYQEKYKSPVEVKIELGPLLKAMREGRIVIIDEINAIPHHTLVILNDLLLTEPGSVVTPPIPGAEPFRVKEGFGVIATGNYKPEDGVMYIGRQPMDAAFLSRLKLIEYDFLPENRSLEPKEGLSPEELRKFRARNELMAMLSVHLTNENLSITAPKDLFETLERLSYVARSLQDVFSGKEVSVEWNARDRREASVPPGDILKENVLSIRHILPILFSWKNDGYSRPFDYYLFTDYISRSGARPEEKLYLYKTLQTMGDFFKTTEGWPEPTDRQAILELDSFNLPVKESDTSKLKTFNAIEVIERIFGPKPERESAPILAEILSGTTNQEEEEKARAIEIERERKAESIKELLNKLGMAV